MTKISRFTEANYRGAVESMDHMAQTALGQVVGISRVLLKALETPGGQRDTAALAAALEAIEYIAASAADSISIDARAVDCNSEDEARHRRWSPPAQAPTANHTLETKA